MRTQFNLTQRLCIFQHSKFVAADSNTSSKIFIFLALEGPLSSDKSVHFQMRISKAGEDAKLISEVILTEIA